MKSSNLLLGACCAVVSIASAALLLELDEAGIITLEPPNLATSGLAPGNAAHASLAPVTEPAAVSSAPPVKVPVPVLVKQVPDPKDRFAYLSLDAALQLPQPVAQPEPAEDDVAEEDEVAEEDVVEEEETAEAEELVDTSSWSADVRQEKPAVGGTKPATVAPSARQREYTGSRHRWHSPAVKKRLAEISPGANARLARKFEAAEASWPPHEVVLIAIKDEKALELFARPEGGEWKFIHRYPVLAASGGPGPKLRQGDKQVPEGIYKITLLNPNSRYHVSLRVNYPNEFDRQMAEADGRKNLGGDIMIHGKAKSAGCLAVGDPAAEELFVLAAQVGLENIKLIIAPTDFRQRGIPPLQPGQPEWLPKLYTEVAAAMTEFKSPPRISLLSLFFGN